MLAQDNHYFKEASETVYELTQEERIRQQCLAREDYNRTMKGIENDFAALKAGLADANQQLSEQSKQLSEQSQQLSEKDQQLSEQSQQLSEYQQHIQALEAQLAEYQAKENSSDK